MHRLVGLTLWQLTSVVLLTRVCYWQPYEEPSFQLHLFRPTEMKNTGNWREPSSNLVSHFWLLHELACSRFHHARLTHISPVAEFPKSKGGEMIRKMNNPNDCGEVTPCASNREYILAATGSIKKSKRGRGAIVLGKLGHHSYCCLSPTLERKVL